MQSPIDFSKELKATVQALLQNKDFFPTSLGPRFFTPVWDTNGMTVFGQDEWKRLNQLPVDTLFVCNILSNIPQINDMFRVYLDELMTDASLRAMSDRLIDYASTRTVPIFPIKEKHSIAKAVNKHIVVLFNTQPNETLTGIGIQPDEQRFFFLAHELGHCALHHHYRSNLKTNQPQTKEYILFNEKMAWHVAHDLLSTCCAAFNAEQLSKQQESCLAQYDKFYSTPQNLNQLFTEM